MAPVHGYPVRGRGSIREAMDMSVAKEIDRHKRKLGSEGINGGINGDHPQESAMGIIPRNRPGAGQVVLSRGHEYSYASQAGFGQLEREFGRGDRVRPILR
jgi:hypothetical protein